MPTGDLYSITYPAHGVTPNYNYGLPTLGTNYGAITPLLEIIPGDNPLRVHRINVTFAEGGDIGQAPFAPATAVRPAPGTMAKVEVALAASVGTGVESYTAGPAVINHINWGGSGAAAQNPPTFQAFIKRPPPVPTNSPGISPVGPRWVLDYFDAHYGWWYVPTPEERPTVDPAAVGLVVAVSTSAATGILGATGGTDPMESGFVCSMVLEEM